MGISDTEIEAIKVFIETEPTLLRRNEQLDMFSRIDLSITLPAIKKLADFGTNEKSELGYNFQQIADAVSNPKLKITDVVIHYKQAILELIESYKGHKEEQVIQNCFEKKISDMNGYEFETYLKLIGAIKPAVPVPTPEP